jgi:hypothetical protein
LHNKHVRSLAYPSWGPSVRIPYLLHVMVLNSIKGFSITVFVKKLHGNVVLHDLKSHFYPLGKSIFVTHKVKTPSTVSMAHGQGDIFLLHITIGVMLHIMPLSSFCPPKIDVALKITIGSKFSSHISKIKW